MGATGYTLYVGTQPDAHDVDFLNAGLNSSATLSNLPADGGTLFVTLYSVIGGKFQARSYTYIYRGWDGE